MFTGGIYSMLKFFTIHKLRIYTNIEFTVATMDFHVYFNLKFWISLRTLSRSS